MNFSDEDIGLVHPAQYTQPAPQNAPAPTAAPAKSLSDADIGLSDSDIGLTEQPKGEFGQWSKAFSDIPSEIGQQYSNAWQGVKEGLNPIGKTADVENEGALSSTLKTGQGLLNAAYLASGVGPAVVGAARSLIGHPMAELEHKVGETFAPQTAAKDNPEEMYQTAAGNAETAMGAMGRMPGAPAPTLVPGMVRRAITPNAIDARRLEAADVWRQATGQEPTAGAITGSPLLQRTETTLGDAPLAGGKYTKAMRKNNEGFSRFAAKSFGETELEPEAFESASDRLGKVFEDSAKNMEIAHSTKFGNTLSKIGFDLNNEGLSDPEIKRIEQMLKNVQNGFVTKTRGPALVDGEAYQTMTRKGTPLERAMQDPNPNISYYATRIRSALDDAMEETVNTAVKNAFSRGKPGGDAQYRAMRLAEGAEQLRDARRQWFNMIAVRGAADEEGVVTPQRLRRALTNTQDRKTMYALSRGDLAPVARAGSLLFRGLPDSNTAQRALLTAIPSAIAGAFLWGEPITGVAAGTAAPGLTGRVLMSRPAQAYLKNQLLPNRSTVPAAPAPTPGTSLISTPGRGIAPWQQRSITPSAAAQVQRRFPWLASGVLPHTEGEQERARGGRALRLSYRAKRADGGSADDDPGPLASQSDPYADLTARKGAFLQPGDQAAEQMTHPFWRGAGQAINDIGLGWLAGMTQPPPASAYTGDSVIQSLLRNTAEGTNTAFQAAMSGPTAGVEGALSRAAAQPARIANPIRAYHGSPHNFDAFDLSRIGTGEGAQAYGHGLYFAEAEPTAQSYRDNLSQVAGETLLWPTAGASDLTKQLILAKNGDIDAAIAHAGQMAGKRRTSDLYAGVIDELQAIKSKGRFEISPGHMYEVNIHADPEHFLDWDKRIGDQSNHVQDILRNRFGFNKGQFLGDVNGGAAYESSKIVPGDFRDQARASESLRQAGIPGIRYLDQGSRAAGDGTRNYVIFDPRLIEIMRKYAIGGTARAHGGRVEAANIDHSPTEAQKKVGNYAKDHVSIHGLDITVENAKGKSRKGVDRDGKPWSVRMPAHYGYIKGTVGKDKDHVDVYLGPHTKSPHVFVVDQVDGDTKKFDEHKTFLGFASKTQVLKTYHAAFSDGRGGDRFGHITEMSVDDFKHWLKSGDTTKPLRYKAAA